MDLAALRTPLIGTALRPFFRLALNARIPISAQRTLIDLGAKILRMSPEVRVESIVLGGRPAERITCGTDDPTTAVLHLHGGGYVVGSLASHRSLASHLAEKSGAAVYLLDYRLAPEHPCPAAVEDTVAAFDELVSDHGYEAGSIAVTGDSAGGGLAVAMSQRLSADKKAMPGALGLMAPWVDPTTPPSRKSDLVLNAAWTRQCAAAYLGGGEPNSSDYAPLLGDVSGLPPTMIQVGSTELLHQQALDLADALRIAGVEVTLEELPTLWHVAQIQASLVREGEQAVTRMSRFLREHSHAVGVEPRASDVS